MFYREHSIFGREHSDVSPYKKPFVPKNSKKIVINLEIYPKNKKRPKGFSQRALKAKCLAR